MRNVLCYASSAFLFLLASFSSFNTTNQQRLQLTDKQLFDVDQAFGKWAPLPSKHCHYIDIDGKCVVDVLQSSSVTPNIDNTGHMEGPAELPDKCPALLSQLDTFNQKLSKKKHRIKVVTLAKLKELKWGCGVRIVDEDLAGQGKIRTRRSLIDDSYSDGTDIGLDDFYTFPFEYYDYVDSIKTPDPQPSVTVFETTTPPPDPRPSIKVFKEFQTADSRSNIFLDDSGGEKRGDNEFSEDFVDKCSNHVTDRMGLPDFDIIEDFDDNEEEHMKVNMPVIGINDEDDSEPGETAIVDVAEIRSDNSIANMMGGERASANERPWQISLRFGGKHVCSGSLVGRRFAVTAAHCFDGRENLKLWSAYLGRDSIAEENTDEQLVKPVKLSNKFIHPCYNSKSRTADVALLEFSRTISVKILARGDVMPICLPTYSSLTALPKIDCWVSGYGTGGDLLQYNVPKFTSNYKCCTKYNISLTRSQMCGSIDYGNTCKVDSGGPMTCLASKKSNVHVLRGIVSVDKSCSRSKMPDVYTNIEMFSEWIHKQIEYRRWERLRKLKKQT